MLATVQSCVIIDLDAEPVQVEVAITSGLEVEGIDGLRSAKRFANLQTVVRVRAERYASKNYEIQSVDDRYFIGSATTQPADALAACSHWQIENSLHWVSISPFMVWFRIRS